MATVYCGPRATDLKAATGRCPGCDGPVEASGDVFATYCAEGTLETRHNLKKLEAGCVDCIGCVGHIHSGTACTTHERVKGHGWNTDAMQSL